MSLGSVAGQLNTCFDQIQTQSTEIVRLRECVSASVDRTGHQSQPVNEDAHLSELNFLKSKEDWGPAGCSKGWELALL